ncbi:uncharacterized protein LOC108696328 isoform X2 [Xenopus laevis]|uniref:Centromere protein Q n=2 Tax=Xenopus laevis TaxID=8355 RepID=A0A8J1L666_XENLA|nr:uncharacterized protein LOC108696328 isoform X2 [Xenopus laevis]
MLVPLQTLTIKDTQASFAGTEALSVYTTARCSLFIMKKITDPSKQKMAIPKKNSQLQKKVRKQNQQSTGLKAKSSKIQGLKELDGRSVQGTKAKIYKPLANSIVEHIEMCLETATLSVSRDLRTSQYVQDSQRCLKQKLLCHCKKMKAPITKMSILKNLKKDICGELQRMEASEETIKCLKDNTEKALDATNRINEQIVDLEQRLGSLTEATNSDTLLLPSASFQAPTMQEYICMLKNPKLLLKDLQLIESSRLSTNMRGLIEKSYGEAESLYHTRKRN